MEGNVTTPIIIPASTAVLLCFLQPALSPAMVQERALLTYRLKQYLPGSVRILKVDERSHPEVVKSFQISQLPAFILVQQGIERWRQEGVHTFEELTSLPSLLEQIKRFKSV